MGDQFGTASVDIHAASEQVAGGTPFGRIGVGDGEIAALEQARDFVGINLIVINFGRCSPAALCLERFAIMKCIYCLEDKEEIDFKKREHVIPQCFGKFTPDKGCSYLARSASLIQHHI